MPRLEYVPLDEIRTNTEALRDVNRQEEDFQQIAASVKQQGVMNAINVRQKPGEDGKRYELIDGLQRYTASTEVGTGVVDTADDGNGNKVRTPRFVEKNGPDGKTYRVGVIPVQVLEREDDEALLSQIVGNVQKIETKPVEYAKGLRRLLSYKPTMTETELAGLLSKSPSWIGKQLGLLKLNEQIKPLVNEGKVVLSNAFVLSKLPTEEQLQWLDRAQTLAPDVFGPQVLERVKAIREANRKGQEAGPEQFKPVRHLRKKPELESEMDAPNVGPQLITELNVLNGIKPNKDGLMQAASAGFQLGLSWALSFDPKSIDAQKQAWTERKAKEDQDKQKRDLEKKEKRAKEAQERTAKAQKEFEEARAKQGAATQGTAAPATHGTPVTA